MTNSAADIYLETLLREDFAKAESLVESLLASGTTIEDLYLEVFETSLHEVGRRWERSEITVAQEHYISAATQQLMASLHGRTFQTPKHTRRLLATSIGGNLHSIGIRMVADVFELGGWTTTYLGPDVASERVIAAVLATRCDVVAVSAMLREHVPRVSQLIGALRERGIEVKILVGGKPFNEDTMLWKEIGADGNAVDARLALEVANELVSSGERVPHAILAEGTGVLSMMPSPPLEDAEGEARSLLAMSVMNSKLHDMTRMLREKHAELERLHAQLNHLMGMAAHDLRNPLTVIRYNIEFLREDLGATLSPEHRGFVDVVEESATFMKTLLDDLLDVSKIRAGRLEVNLAPLELIAFVSRVVDLNATLAQRKQIQLVVEAPHTSRVVQADGPKLQQLLNNLVGNAIQYSPQGAAVRIAVALFDDHVVLGVHDRGRGIARAEIDKVFRPFETTSTKGTAGEKSTGLGLAIVLSIAEAHGGTAWVDSTQGVGSSFYVRLPFAA